MCSDKLHSLKGATNFLGVRTEDVKVVAVTNWLLSYFSDIYILQGIAATRFRCGGIFMST